MFRKYSNTDITFIYFLNDQDWEGMTRNDKK